MSAPVTLTDIAGIAYVSGRMNNLFTDATVGGDTDYRLVEVRASAPVTSLRAWLGADPTGGVLAIASGDPTARATDYTYSVTPSALTYSTPTTQDGGISLPDLAAGQKALIVVRRTLAGASAASPETNTLLVGGNA